MLVLELDHICLIPLNKAELQSFMGRRIEKEEQIDEYHAA